MERKNSVHITLRWIGDVVSTPSVRRRPAVVLFVCCVNLDGGHCVGALGSFFGGVRVVAAGQREEMWWLMTEGGQRLCHFFSRGLLCRTWQTADMRFRVCESLPFMTREGEEWRGSGEGSVVVGSQRAGSSRKRRLFPHNRNVRLCGKSLAEESGRIGMGPGSAVVGGGDGEGGGGQSLSCGGRRSVVNKDSTRLIGVKYSPLFAIGCGHERTPDRGHDYPNIEQNYRFGTTTRERSTRTELRDSCSTAAPHSCSSSQSLSTLIGERWKDLFLRVGEY